MERDDGNLIGGWVNEWLDWRWAFIIAGVPGLGIALLVRLTVKEPPRGYSEGGATAAESAAPPFWTVVRTLFDSAILRNTVIGGSLVTFTGYALVLWVPVFLVRVHGMGTGEAGSVLALLVGVGGAYIGPSFALIQSHIPLRMRSVAAAINLFITNLVGLGFGPLTVGLISDFFADSAGLDSLRYGLLSMIPFAIWGALHYLRAGFLLDRQSPSPSVQAPG